MASTSALGLRVRRQSHFSSANTAISPCFVIFNASSGVFASLAVTSSTVWLPATMAPEKLTVLRIAVGLAVSVMITSKPLR